MGWRVIEERGLKQILRRATRLVVKEYERWKAMVTDQGPEKLQTDGSFEDHELEDEWEGFRASWLGDLARVIYEVDEQDGTVRVEKVTTSHDYSREEQPMKLKRGKGRGPGRAKRGRDVGRHSYPNPPGHPKASPVFVPEQRHVELSSSEFVRLTRRAHGWTQAELARRSGVSQSALSAIESGALRIGPERALKLARVFGCSAELVMSPQHRYFERRA